MIVKRKRTHYYLQKGENQLDKAEIIGLFQKVAENPGWQARQWKEERKGKIIGFLLTDVPEELIHAAGFLPYGICGGQNRLDSAIAHLQNWACSYVRSSLALALERKLDFLDGLIIPQSCDTTRMVLGIWQHASPLPFLQNFRLPRQVNRPSAREYLIGELAQLKEQLEIYRGAHISTEELRNSIKLYNNNRSLLRKLYLINEQNPEILSTKVLYTLIKGSMLIPREKVNGLLTKLLKALEGETSPSGNDHIPLIISGTLLEPFELLDYLDEGGGVIVGDDLQNGFRYIDGDVKEDVDPLEALADRQLNRIPFAGYDLARNPRRFFLSKMAVEKKARGVIFLHLKHCEPENYDYYDNAQALEKAGIPSIRIETEFGITSLGQILTRVQAFLELVGGK
jgi:bcr-type benzoyl-CoA reductase subunit C